ncbi:MAG: hypothetical protein L3J41_12280 [Melioribacteraceae bacterium]|nr:hypothetical protein [Melioribacteraceae bacterium]
MKKIILVIILFSSLLTNGQIKDSSNFFISAEIEYFIISKKNTPDFAEYSYVNGVSYGVGLGYAVSHNFYVVISYAYVPLKEMIENRESGDSRYNILIKHSLFKIGVQKNIISNNTIVIGLLGGINITAVKEKYYIKDSNDLVRSSKGNIWGFFVGFALEKKIKNFPISILSKAQYFGGHIFDFLNAPDIGTRIGFQFGLGVKYSF